MGEQVLPDASLREGGHVVGGSGAQCWTVVSQPMSEQVALSRHVSPRGSSPYWHSSAGFGHGALVAGMVLGHGPGLSGLASKFGDCGPASEGGVWGGGLVPASAPESMDG